MCIGTQTYMQKQEKTWNDKNLPPIVEGNFYVLC